METQNRRKFCPICKLDNDSDAVVCAHCNARLDKTISDAPTTLRTQAPFAMTEQLREQVIKGYVPPAHGLSLFLLNNSEPIALLDQPQIILGREGELNTDSVYDLSRFEGYAMGVSRRHAMIKFVEDKYTLIDLNSSNGTWLNGNRLLSNKPRDLPSGGVIQLGTMKLVVVYALAPVSK